MKDSIQTAIDCSKETADDDYERAYLILLNQLYGIVSMLEYEYPEESVRG